MFVGKDRGIFIAFGTVRGSIYLGSGITDKYYIRIEVPGS
jgi:hypothetical protein